jgi:P27 family predicted phage terminase small subunit
MTGPPPKPTALKLLDGNPGKRALNQFEPQLDIAEPACPDYLDEGAQREWKRIVPILMKMRVLTEADGAMLGIWCQTYSTMIDLQRKLAMTGTLHTPKKGGYVQTNPLFNQIQKCINVITRISSEFGLTSSARVRLHSAPPPDEGNKWSQFQKSG